MLGAENVLIRGKRLLADAWADLDVLFDTGLKFRGERLPLSYRPEGLRGTGLVILSPWLLSEDRDISKIPFR